MGPSHGEGPPRRVGMGRPARSSDGGEARIVGDGVIVGAAGLDAGGGWSGPGGAAGVISFGLCGGLDPALAAG